MPKIISIPSRKIEAEFPDSMPDEEIKSILKQKYPRTGGDVAYDISQFSNIADTRDFIAKMPDNEYIMLNNHKADNKLSWGELAGIAGDAIGTIVGDVVKGAKATVTKAGDGVAESALRGVAAGTVDLVNLGQKLITPNERIPTFEEFAAKTPSTTRLVDSPQQQGATGLTYAWPSEEVSATTEDDYKQYVNRQRQMELQALDIADVSEKLIQGAPVPEVAKGASYLDAVTLAGLAKSVARSGVKSIYKAVAKKPLVAAASVAPEVVPEMAAKGAYTGFETGTSFVPKNPFVANAEKFATKVGEGARKAGLTGVQLGAGTVKGAADLGKGVINLAERLGLENAALRGSIGGAIGYKEGGVEGALMGTVLGSVVPKAIKGTVSGISRTADFIGAAAKVAKSGPSRTGIFEKMAQAANISPEARKIAEKVLFTQPFVQYASEATKQAAKNALLGVPVGAALGYAADGEEGAAAGAGAGFAIGGMVGPLDASFDAIKSIAGRSTARSQRNAAGDINSFVNDITDDQARSDYGEIMNRAIQIAGPERAADMLDSLRLAEGMGANVKVVPVSERKNAFNSFSYNDTNGGTITINPDRMNAGSIQHEVFHQLFNVGIRGELQKALSDVYLPKKDADGNIIQNGLFDDKEFAKKAAELAKKYIGNEKGYKDALEFASTLDNPAGFSPEAVDKAREFVIDEMTAAYTEKFMGRSRTGVFNPDRLPMWHRQILENIDDKILNRINDKIFADKSIKDPTAFFTDAEGKPVRVPQLDPVLKRAFSRNLNRDRNIVGKPREVIAPKNPRELASWAAATFGATRDVLDPTGQRPLTEQERKVITAADFDAAKALYQSLPDDAKQTVRVTKKSGVPTDINSKGARIEITSQTPSNVFDSFLQVAKDRGMGNQQLANMRQLYASMAMDDGPTFDTVNNPVYKYNPKTGKMTPGVRPASKQEIYPTAITVNSAGGFNVEYIDLSRVKANAQKILDNPKYKGVWNGIDDFMADFGSSLRNLSKGEAAAMPSAELLGKGNEKVGAMKRDLIAEAMNVTLPKRLEYINQPTIDPLTLATKEGKDRRTEGSAFRDFRIERLTNVTPTNNRLKMVKEDAYDIFVQRFQPDAFTPETLPNGEAFTNPDGYRILNKAGSKLFRTYDDTGKLIGIAESKEKAMKKAQDEFAKKAMKEEKDNEKRFQASPDDDALIKRKQVFEEAKNEGAALLQSMLNEARGRLPNRNTGGEWIITESSKPDVIVQVTSIGQDGVPIRDMNVTTQEGFNDLLRDPELIEAATLKIRPDIAQAMGANLKLAKARKDYEYQYRLRLREVGPGTAPSGWTKASGREVSYDRPLTSAEIKDFELQPIGANIVLKSASKSPTEMRFQAVTPEQDAAFLAAAKAGDTETAQRITDEAAKQAGYPNRVGNLFVTGKIPIPSEIKGYDYGQQIRKLLIEKGHAQEGFSENSQVNWNAALYDESMPENWDRWLDVDDQGQVFIEGVLGNKKPELVIARRRGMIPDHGTSKNLRENIQEKGVSVIEVLKPENQNKGGQYDITLFDKPDNYVIGWMLDPYNTTGGDNEPLLRGATVLGKVGKIDNQIKSADPITYDDAGNIIPLSQRFNQASPDIRFQPDPTSPNILNGTDGSRIIKSTSNKYRVYLATGALAGVKDTLESAQKLVQAKSKSYATN